VKSAKLGSATIPVTVNTIVPATMSTPVNGSTLASATQTFIWSNTGATEYQIHVGSAPGTSDLGTYVTATNSADVTGIPTNGSTVYIRLWTWTGTQFLFNDYTYTAFNIIAATMSTPANGSTLAGATQTFNWSNTGATEYQLHVGSTPGGTDLGIYVTAATNNSVIVTGLPTNGSAVYVRLWTWNGAQFLFNDYTYTASNIIAAAISSPANGSSLVGATRTFNWNNAGATEYQVHVGSTPGGSDLGIYITATNSADVTGLPANGSTVYVRLWTWNGSVFLFNDFNYTSN